MKQAEPFLYPKLSSIYNKILQLVGAILLIIFLMALLQSIGGKNKDNLTKHFNYIAKQQLNQAIAGVAVILEQTHENNRDKKILLQHYLDGLARVNFVNQAHLYDETGLLIVSSASAANVQSDSALESNTVNANIDKEKTLKHPNNDSPKAKNINELYGVTPFTRDLSGRFKPFIAEVLHTDITEYKLHGYLRFTIEPSYLVETLTKADEEQQSLQRLMLLLAGMVGFLLTRGLNRFSRRGYRLTENQAKTEKS